MSDDARTETTELNLLSKIIVPEALVVLAVVSTAMVLQEHRRDRAEAHAAATWAQRSSGMDTGIAAMDARGLAANR